MSEKFKKIDKDYVLSDSSVNEYGFRLLTSGCQLDNFLKNPIGYYMHRREDGVALKWEDVRIEDDKIVGKPVINLANSRGLQTCDEAEGGFLNAASVGHIVVLEHSNEPALMLPGQTGPTITKWYHKECSLVDIPGNSNALARLYDEQENEINLADLSAGNQPRHIGLTPLHDLCRLLNLADNAGESALLPAVKELVANKDRMEQEILALHNERLAQQQQIEDLQAGKTTYEINNLLEKALEDKKITRELQLKLAEDYANNPLGLELLLKAMPAYRSIVDTIRHREREKPDLQWSWDDFETNDPTGMKLRELKANYPDRYREIFKEKFEG